MLTDSRLTAIRQAVEELKKAKGQATEGPWVQGGRPAQAYVYRSPDPHNGNGFGVGSCIDPQDIADAAYITATRNTSIEEMAAELIAEVERLWRLVYEPSEDPTP